ncbi:MAG: cysteinyl-tRNA synthetase [Myxococcota bacterium]|jgi:cysteinyl-tRNA synthetase
MAAPFRLYNTLTKEIEAFEPLEAGKVKIYVCGNTVYDHAHIGHARAMVTFSTFVRYLRHRGWDVHFVRNFTDVDDKIIARANEKGEEPLAMAQRFIDSYRSDVEALGLVQPDDEPCVSGCIQDILDTTAKLIEKGHAYVNDGTVWYSIDSFPEYGKLSRQNVAELKASADESSGKKNPADFALWKAAKPGEPAWDSPWGGGRPGWHIECSAMSSKHLGDSFDIHGGGLDLVFPHHENEIAQSEAASGKQYAKYWMHNGMLTMQTGQKMGKSLGNVVAVHLALDQFPAESMVLYYLQNLYRSSLPWSDEALPDALAMLSRMYDARERAESMGGSQLPEDLVAQLGKDARDVYEQGITFKQRFYEAMDYDFNTGKALGILFELVRAVNRFAMHKKAKKRGGPLVAPALDAFRLVGEALGFLQMDVRAFHDEVKVKRLKAMGLSAEWVEEALQKRMEAREAKDWETADQVRKELEAKSIVVMDTPRGVQWRIGLRASSEAQ